MPDQPFKVNASGQNYDISAKKFTCDIFFVLEHFAFEAFAPETPPSRHETGAFSPVRRVRPRSGPFCPLSLEPEHVVWPGSSFSRGLSMALTPSATYGLMHHHATLIHSPG